MFTPVAPDLPLSGPSTAYAKDTAESCMNPSSVINTILAKKRKKYFFIEFLVHLYASSEG